MKTQKRKRVPLYAIFLISAIVVLAGAASVFALINNNPPADTTDETDSTQQSSDEKKDFIENTDENGQPKNTDGSSIESSISFTLTEDADSIIVQTHLADISNGECTLIVGDFSVSAPILYQPEFSTCEGFSIKKSDINTTDLFTLEVHTDSETFTTSKRLGE